jgi:hypothetical protein
MSFGSKALQILQTVAPTVALAVGGPFGPLASAAISAALGTPKGDDKAAEAALLTATPDQLLALTKENDSFKAQMKQFGIEEQKLVYDDVANARAREVALKDNTPSVLVYLTTTGFFASLLGAFLVTIPDSSKGIVFSMIGSLGTVWITQMGFYFGSSMGSASKTDVINKIASTK